MSRDNDVILLCKMFSGGFSKKETNIAHEVINLLKTDNSENYIFVLPHGGITKDKNNRISCILLTTFVENGKFAIIAKIENPIQINYCGDQRIQNWQVQKKIHDKQISIIYEKKIQYGGVDLHDIMRECERNEESVYVTFSAPNGVKRAKKPLEMNEKVFARWRSKYFIDSITPESKKIKDLIDNEDNWETEDCSLTFNEMFPDHICRFSTLPPNYSASNSLSRVLENMTNNSFHSFSEKEKIEIRKFFFAVMREKDPEYQKIINVTDFLKDDDDLKGFYKELLTKVRVNQSKFRDRIIYRFNCNCALCEINKKELLTASHIKPWSKCEKEDDRVAKENGLLLCPDHDALFDAGLISFDKNGKIMISPTLDKKNQKALRIDLTMKLDDIIAKESEEFMAYHRDHVYKK